jgi:hypothetical protein
MSLNESNVADYLPLKDFKIPLCDIVLLALDLNICI